MIFFRSLMLKNCVLLKGTEVNNGTFVFNCVLLSSESHCISAELLGCLSYKELYAAGLILYFYDVAERFQALLFPWHTKAEVRIFSDIIEALKLENKIVLSEQRRTISNHRSSFQYCKLFEVLICDADR